MSISAVVLLTFLTHIGFAGSRVTVALFAVDHGSAALTVGSIVSMYALFPALLAVYAGRITDRLGFWLPMLAGAIGVLLGLLLPFLLPSLAILYLAAPVLGLSFMTFQLAAQTLAGAIATPAERGRNFSLVSLGFAAGNFTGPLIAGFLIDHVGHARTFLALSLPVALASAAIALGGRRMPRPQGEGASRGGRVADLLGIKPLRNTFIASGIVSSAWDLYQFFMPIYGRAQGLSATSIGVVLSAFAVAIVLVRVFLSFAVRRFDEARLLTWSMFVACAAYSLFPLLGSAWALAAVSFLLGIGCGCGQPLSMTLIYNASPPGRSAEATGIRITVNNCTHFMIPLLFGALGSAAGFASVFIANAGFLALGGYVSARNNARR
ncbi:MAG TPA: MFS transporter [Burkholderiales bacterium]|nr:MFS transporter [Burkholderiales bacterium]